MKPNLAPSHSTGDQIAFISHAAILREEGRRTRATIWMVAFVVIGCVIFAPFLFIAAPVLAVVLGASFIAAFGGALLGKLIARKKERRLMSEIRHHNDRVVSMYPSPDHTQADQARGGSGVQRH